MTLNAPTLRGLLAVAAAAAIPAQAALHDRGGGLIYDDQLNVTWLQNVTLAAGTVFDDDYGPDKAESPGTDGLLSWYSAMAWVDQLAYYDAVRNVTWTDWRLPKALPSQGSEFLLTPRRDGSTDVGYNITSPLSELSHMFYVSLGNLGQYSASGALQTGFGFVDDAANPNDESLFRNLRAGTYWYSTIRPDNDTNAFEFRARYGNVSAGYLGYTHYAWAVRDGDVAAAAVPEPGTWAMLAGGLAVIGAMVRRRRNTHA